MEFNIREYIMTTIAPLLYRLGYFDTPTTDESKEGRLEKRAIEMPRITPDKKRVPYKSKTVSKTCGQRGRRG